MYMLDYYSKQREEANVLSSPELWHQRLGHINYEYLRQKNILRLYDMYPQLILISPQ
jgi:hypothetical protein